MRATETETGRGEGREGKGRSEGKETGYRKKGKKEGLDFGRKGERLFVLVCLMQ